MNRSQKKTTKKQINSKSDTPNGESSLKKRRTASTASKSTRAVGAKGKSLSSEEVERAKFSKGMTQWLESREYQIGISPKNIDHKEEVNVMKKMIEIGSSLVSTGMPFFISGDVSSAQVFDSIVPFVPLSDILGFHVDGSTAYLALVVYADKLDTGVILNRLEQLTQLAKPLADLGVRMNGQSLGAGYVHLLLVYFDGKEYAEKVPVLLPQGARRSVWDRIYLYTGFINVADKTVAWSEDTGALSGIRSSMASLLGTTKKALQIFDGNDLQSVLILANQ
ncbi:MAG TPA: hypothetical protein VGX92_03615 [Pyrinomonadaceae bacterium]|jgi:hypothetical protein|nr:hypothetical protein [Pyrinomonadaceae bacterium]